MNWDYSHNPNVRPLGCNGRYGNSGRRRHQRRGEMPCRKCTDSANHYKRETRRGQPMPRRLKPCGTPAAASRHRFHSEPLDFACMVAEARHRTELRQKSGSAKKS